MNTLLTRKEIAQMINVSVRQVVRNEVRWGLRMARVNFNARTIRYRSAQVMREFKVRGFLE